MIKSIFWAVTWGEAVCRVLPRRWQGRLPCFADLHEMCSHCETMVSLWTCSESLSRETIILSLITLISSKCKFQFSES